MEAKLQEDQKAALRAIKPKVHHRMKCHGPSPHYVHHWWLRVPGSPGCHISKGYSGLLPR